MAHYPQLVQIGHPSSNIPKNDKIFANYHRHVERIFPRNLNYLEAHKNDHQ